MPSGNTVHRQMNINMHIPETACRVYTINNNNFNRIFFHMFWPLVGGK